MKNKKLALLALTAGLSVLSCIPAFASGWQKDAVGWWYGTNGNNTTWYNSGWQWVDGNNDGIAECYYFNSNGYISVNGVVDNYTVNVDGAWTVNGIVQTKQVSLSDKSNDKVTSSENQTSTSSQSKGSYYDGMPVDRNDAYQTEWDLDGDGKLTGIEYDMYIARKAMDGIEQHNSHKGNIS